MCARARACLCVRVRVSRNIIVSETWANPVPEACSHGRSYVYFTESINSKTGLIARKCGSWDRFMAGSCEDGETVLMGEHVDRAARGSYFLRTRSEAPYAYQEEMTDNNV